VWDGAEWSEPIDIFYASRGSPFIPAIAVDPWGEVHVVFDWQGIEGIYYMHAPAELAQSAQAWSTPITINNGAHSYFSDIVADGQGTVHAVWEDRTAPQGGGETFYSQLPHESPHWSEPINLSNSPNVMSTQPRLVVDQGQNVHVTWSEGGYDKGFEVYYAKSTDAGQIWPLPMRIDPNCPERGPTPFLDAYGQLHIVWGVGSGTQVKHTAWNGSSWSNTTVVATFQPIHNIWPQGVADSNGHLYVVWRSDQKDIYYSTSSDNGVSWSEPIVLGTTDWRVDLVVRLGHELIAVWGNQGRLYYSTLDTGILPWTSAPLPPTPTPLFTATPSPAIITPTSTPALAPAPVSSMSPSSGGQGAYPIVLSVGVTAALISIVVAIQLRRTREQ
jgi:hypothetical protein